VSIVILIGCVCAISQCVPVYKRKALQKVPLQFTKLPWISPTKTCKTTQVNQDVNSLHGWIYENFKFIISILKY